MKHLILTMCFMMLLATPSHASEPLPAVDMENLKAAMEVTRVAAESGNPPFGAVIAGPDGTILMTQENLSLKMHDYTKHAEAVLASKFCQAYFKQPEFRAKATLYSSMEPCAMCMFTMYAAGIGRVVYGLSTDRLYAIFDQYGTWPRANLTSHEAAGYMSSPMAVAGPYLEDEAAAIVEGALERFAAEGKIRKKGAQ